MSMHRRIAFIIGVALVSSMGTHNARAYSVEANKINDRLLIKEEKLAGSDRYETSIKVSNEGWKNGATNVVLVNDVSIVDALSATPFADAKDAPILLTQKDSLNEKTRDQLKKLGVKNVYIVGGEGVVSKNVEEQLKLDGINVDRIQGANREDTALEVAKRLNDIKPITEVTIVNGYKGLADAVSIAAVAADKDMPIILSKVDGTSAEVDKFIESKNINNSYIIGGEGVISKSLEGKLPNAKRIAGQNRKDTNAKVIDTFYESNELGNIYVTKDGAKNENQLIDALAVGALAAKTDSPVILVSNNLDDVQKDVINTKLFKNITQIGGNGNETAFDELIKIQSEEIYNVSTIDELNRAIARANANDTINVNLDKNVKSNEDIIINTNKKISLNLKGIYDNTIKITSENLKVTNEGKIKNILIEGKNYYNFISLINNGTIESLIIKNGVKINLDNSISSTITTLQIDKDVSKVNINNLGKIENLIDNSSQTTITGSGSVNKPETPNNPGNDGISSETSEKVDKVVKLIDGIDGSIVLANEKTLEEIEENLEKIESEYNVLSDEEKK